ncbi:MAG: hypothetical protein IJ817_03290 [Clostridia bacterium]|nr:hypothetical protein [Clostridia bacterium]
MLLIPIICTVVGTLVFAITSCFTKSGHPLNFLLKVLALACLVGVGLACGNYHNQFGGFTLLSIISILPMFIANYDLKSYLALRQDEETQNKPGIVNRFVNSNGNLFFGIGTFLSALCLSFAGLYKGYETFYSFLIGLALGLSMTFLALLLRKKVTSFDFFGFLLIYTAGGLLASNILAILLFEMSLANIIVCIGLAILIAHAILRSTTKIRFFELLYYVGMMFIFSVLVF